MCILNKISILDVLNMILPKDYISVSFDVVSLFSNIPIDLLTNRYLYKLIYGIWDPIVNNTQNYPERNFSMA